MLIPALLVTGVIVWMLFAEYKVEVPYKRNIIYVESWPLNRSDAEIHAAQVADQETKKKALVQPKIEQKQLQLQFRKVDAWMTAHGI